MRNSICLLSLLFTFTLFGYSQGKQETALVYGSISINKQSAKDIESQTNVAEIRFKDLPLAGRSKKKNNSKKVSLLEPKPVPELTEAPVGGGYVLFRDDKGKEFRVIADDLGMYKIELPFGKYFVYATASSSCWMCAEYYNHNFLIEKTDNINLEILLNFIGEG